MAATAQTIALQGRPDRTAPHGMSCVAVRVLLCVSERDAQVQTTPDSLKLAAGAMSSGRQ
jgi:hypothetical protein